MAALKRSSDKKGLADGPRVEWLDRFDPFLRDPELRGAYRALMDGEWSRLEGFLQTSPKSWVFCQTVTSPTVGLERVNVERWVDVNDNPFARVLLAGITIHQAFEVRSSTSAQVSTDGRSRRDDRRAVDDFHSALTGAEQVLNQVIHERPAMAEPWVFLLVSGRGLGLHLEELRERFDGAHSRDPFRADACHEYLQGLTPKWGGSQPAVFDFARWLETEAPVDSPSRECLPIAHIENGLLQQSEEGLTEYLADPNVARELVDGLTRFLGITPVDGLSEHLGTLNAYALALKPFDSYSAQLIIETFARIDERPTAFPWSLYRDNIVRVYHEVRRDQLRLANRFL